MVRILLFKVKLNIKEKILIFVVERVFCGGSRNDKLLDFFYFCLGFRDWIMNVNVKFLW